MNKNKVATLIAIGVLSCSSVPALADTNDSVLRVNSELYVRVVGDSEVEISLISPTEEVIIPATVNVDGTEYNVVGVGSNFLKWDEASKVVLPEGVRYIADSAFADRGCLVSVELPSTLERIGNSAFSECHSLGDGCEIVLPSSVTSIGENSFYNCSSLDKLILSSNLSEIPASAFYGCISLGHSVPISIPEGVTKIGDNAFYDSRSLAGLSLPSTLNFIGDSAFYNCVSLTSLSIPNGVSIISSNAFYNCNSLETLSLPSSITKIGDYAFSNCKTLSSLTLPASVEKVGNYAFSECNNLESLSLSSALTSIGDYGFSKCRSLQTIDFNSCNLSNLGVGAFEDCNSLTSLDMSDSVDLAVIDNNTFCNCRTLSDVIFPPNIETIGSSAFKDCMSLSSLDFPISLTNIGDEAFYNCKYIPQFIFYAVENIGDRAFFNCTYLNDVEFRNVNMTHLGVDSFKGCFMDRVVVPQNYRDDADAFKSFMENFPFKYIVDANNGIENNILINHSENGDEGIDPTLVLEQPDTDIVHESDASLSLQGFAFTMGGSDLIDYDSYKIYENGVDTDLPEPSTFSFFGLRNAVPMPLANSNSDFYEMDSVRLYGAWASNTVYYDVTFKDADGTILKVDHVESGHSAVPPVVNDTATKHFIGWSSPIDNISSNLEVVAQYTAITTPPVTVHDISADDVEVENRADATVVVNGVQADVTYTYNIDGVEHSISGNSFVVNAPNADDLVQKVVNIRGSDGSSCVCNITFKRKVETVTPPVSEPPASNTPPASNSPSNSSPPEADNPSNNTPPVNNQPDNNTSGEINSNTDGGTANIGVIKHKHHSSSKDSNREDALKIIDVYKADDEIIDNSIVSDNFYSWDNESVGMQGDLKVSDGTFVVSSEALTPNTNVDIYIDADDDSEYKLYSYMSDIGKYALLSDNINTGEGKLSFKTTKRTKYIATKHGLDAKDVACYWYSLGGDNWLFIDKYTDERVYGWHKANAGEWSHLGVDTQGDLFHLDEITGIMDYSWYNYNGSTYYLEARGVKGVYGGAVTGEQIIDGKVYSFDSEGRLL